VALKHELSSKGDNAELELGIDFDTYLDKVLNVYLPQWLDYGFTKSKQGGKVSVINNQTCSFVWYVKPHPVVYTKKVEYTFCVKGIVSVTGIALYNTTEEIPF
jgi:hypothetical protein